MKAKKSTIIVYFFAILWIIVTLFPLLITFLSSVKDNAGITLGMLSWPEEWLWSNYVRAFTGAYMGRAVLNSIFVSFATTIVVIVIGMMAAYVLARKKFKLRGLVYSLFILGVMVPVHVAVIPIAGLASRFDGRNSYWFLILVYTAFNLSQAIFLFTGYLLGVDRELDEAAIIDGCNNAQLLWRILFPLSKPIISTVSILTFIFAYGELVFAMILLSDSTMFTTARAMLAFQGGFQEQLGPIFASIIIAVVPMIAIYSIFHERIQSGMLAGAVKG